MSDFAVQRASLWCWFCCIHTTTPSETADVARYCSTSCAHAASEDRRARRRGVSRSFASLMTAAHWRLTVGERYTSGSVVAVRPRCDANGKVRYESPTEAWLAAFIDNEDDPGLHAYPCGHCEGVHLGHKNRPSVRIEISRARRAFEKALGQMLPTIQELRVAERQTAEAS